ncbi:hypothetical protein H6G20_20415 [Desertifilum sp. FACHB-1129]|uniref:Cadherin domain-containing protein n=1 Tax=Desertifilum tharense IPPAS B-1220 TaxID=1781255 RepID=A0A1E5QJA0_9CYAN|nr:MULTISPECIES: Calx-beta domain-containing protein [Desertifilum]MDA0209540.1 hypothetical protein [Cyanobacteria bacterium FC1]MBD2314037.1 hypothetical protein [Desertifilum sp. FACHB-1129]MBD2321003.1 hypothetical protein [Desertifilum sp. FACHB-866]MBD2331132.1 hypothetical protein [Desertifilum sp. FACHB-868]OEJ74647.1 hypothetical protein BH720_13320 [Desertifilum tharense IPPAS B-1220]
MLVITGTPGDDTLIGTLQSEVIFANAGDDWIEGVGGNNILYGDQGNDSIFGGLGDDILYGNGGDDWLEGGEGNDILFGGHGNDTLIGGLGNNRLSGDAGNDLLQSFNGSDTLTGGVGDDTFAIAPTTGGFTLEEATIITDFHEGTNVIELTNGLDFSQLRIFQGSGQYSNDTIIQDQTSDRFLLILQGVAVESIDRNDFIPPPAAQPGSLQFSASTFRISEDGTPITAVTVTRIGGSQGEVSVVLTLTDGSATAPDDYDNTPIVVTFADGDITPKTVNIPIVDDDLVEGDETVNLFLSNPSGGATLGSNQTATLIIIDNDFPGAPTGIELSNNTLDENSPAGSVIGLLSTLDPDVGDTHTYTLLDDADGRFTLNGNQLVVAPGAMLDFETTPSFNIAIRTTDSTGLTYDAVFTIALNDVNEAPIAIELSNNTIDEQSPSGTLIGLLSTLDPDIGDTHTYSLLDDASGRFEIENNQLVVADSSLLEAAAYQITIRSTDAGGLFLDRTFNIQVDNVNQAPIGIELSNNNVDERSPEGTVVGIFSTLDPDTGDTHTYTLLDDAEGRFTLDGDRLIVADGMQIDFETNATHSITIQTTDAGGLSYTETLIIDVNDLNDAPILDPSSDLRFSPINQNLNVTRNNGTLVANMLVSAGTTPIFDPDAGAVQGIAVIGVDDSNGVWEYSTDGGATWQEFGAISPTEATVLRDTPNDRIRFLPNLNFIGSADILFQAWDATDGNPSGTQNIDASLAGGTTAFSLASDTAAISVVQPIYIADTSEVSPGANAIRRTDLGATGLIDLVVNLGDPLAIALDSERGKMYWTDDTTNRIQRANLDGTGVENLIVSGLDRPRAIALDLFNDKIYWVDSGRDIIERANLDGTGREVVLDLGGPSPALFPTGIALDVPRNQMYWTDGTQNTIHRANLDGTGAEIIVGSGLVRPRAIALDLSRDRVYWTDLQLGSIESANLDGSARETLVSGLSFPTSLAIDPFGGKMYWADSTTDKLQRANLDGSGIEDLLTANRDFDPTGIALLF